MSMIGQEKEFINELGSKPKNFKDILNFGDFIYLKINDGFYTLDQIPEAEAINIY